MQFWLSPRITPKTFFIIVYCWSIAVLSSKAFFHTECNLCFLFLVLFFVRDISLAAFKPDLLSNSDILLDTKKQLQLQLLTLCVCN